MNDLKMIKDRIDRLSKYLNILDSNYKCELVSWKDDKLGIHYFNVLYSVANVHNNLPVSFEAFFHKDVLNLSDEELFVKIATESYMGKSQEEYLEFITNQLKSDEDNNSLSEVELKSIIDFSNYSYEAKDKTTNKYTVSCKDINIDVYDVLKAFDVNCPALQHLIKKALKAGGRGHKDKITDLNDIVDSAKRALELEVENKEK